ncbi:hypothetical protein [Luteolibacter luteus]|uniref:Uncharacterized protein n=1 Tax=Luteolibacter luteus TaxID=2728835 RepID=A0A858RHC9_9BACT|nr:hypothetical protein [Luteolibacter luteus]QJE95954.1 hypothetical protein HHL09_09225 [Luteolibacter luteus]
MPSAPVTVDLSVLTGPWPGFTISGCTGGEAAAVNGNYRIANDPGEASNPYFLHVNGTAKIVKDAPTWDIYDPSNTKLFNGGPAPWPWLVDDYSPTSGIIGGEPVFTHWTPPPITEDLGGGESGDPQPPVTVDLGGAVDPVAASLTTAIGTPNANLKFTAREPGRIGDGISIEITHPGGINRPLRVETPSKFEIVVYFATNGSGGPTSTATQIKAAIEANVAANALVSIANAPGNNGSGLLTLTKTYLSGGEGGLPKPPIKVDI